MLGNDRSFCCWLDRHVAKNNFKIAVNVIVQYCFLSNDKIDNVYIFEGAVHKCSYQYFEAHCGHLLNIYDQRKTSIRNRST